MTSRDFTPHEPSKRQLRSWLLHFISHPIRRTIQIGAMRLSPFSKLKDYLRGHLFHSNDDEGEIVTTCSRRSIVSVEFYSNDLRKLIHLSKKRVTIYDDYVEKESASNKRAHFSDYFPISFIKNICIIYILVIYRNNLA